MLRVAGASNTDVCPIQVFVLTGFKKKKKKAVGRINSSAKQNSSSCCKAL